MKSIEILPTRIVSTYGKEFINVPFPLAQAYYQSDEYLGRLVVPKQHLYTRVESSINECDYSPVNPYADLIIRTPRLLIPIPKEETVLSLSIQVNKQQCFKSFWAVIQSQYSHPLTSFFENAAIAMGIEDKAIIEEVD